MRKTKKAIASLAIAGMVLSMAPMSVFGATTDSNRLAGAGRVETAIAIAAEGWTTSDSVIVVPADDANIVDALAAAPLAGQLNAPILVTYKGALDPQVQAEIVKLGAKNVYAVGALSADTVASLKAISGVTVTSLQGADRTETAAKVAAQLTGVKGSFVVAYDGKADALSAASFAAANDYSIVIANPDGTIPASEKVVAPVYTVGGQVSYAGATALAGADRYATNDEVLNGLTFNYDKVYVANGQSLVDALAGAPLAAQTNSPIVLGDAVDVATGANDNLTADSKVIALGGTGAVSDSVLAKVAYQAPTTLAVESVSAVNGSQLKVNFTREVDKTSAETEANYAVTKKGENTPVVLASYAAALQTGDKSVVITLPDAYAVDKDSTTDFVVTVNGVEMKDDSSSKTPLFSTTVKVSDTTAPAITKIEANTNSDNATTVDITFSEPIKSGVIKINGKAQTPSSAQTSYSGATAKASNKVTVTVADADKLAVGKTHTVELVNLTDRANNSVSLLSQSFSVTKDTVAPTVATMTNKSDSGIALTFSKKMDTNTVNSTNIKVKDEAYAEMSFTISKVTSDTTNTKWNIALVDPSLSALYDDKSSRTLTVVFSDDVEDYLGNAMDVTIKSITLTEDTTAPTVTGITFNKSGDNVTSIVAKFSEDVYHVTTPGVIDVDGVAKSGFITSATVDGNEVTYDIADQELDGIWTLVFAKGAVTDKSVGTNDLAAYTGTVNFGTASSTAFKFGDAGSITTSSAITSGVYGNTITVDYGVVVKGGAVAGSATDGNNYTLNGIVLSGAEISLNGTKKVATIKVPVGTVVKSDASSIFSINNVKNADSVTITPYVTTLGAVDDTRPVLQSAQLIGDSLILAFDEALAAPTIADVATLFQNFEIKSGSDVITGGAFTYSLVAGDAKKLQINFATAPTNWDTDKTITVKTLSTGTAIKDVQGNVTKSSVVVTVVK